MEYLDTADIIYINETQLGPGGLCNPDLLESAIQRPQMAVYGRELFDGVHEKAAALIDSLINYHPFVNANKRTAFLADVAFYAINGYDLCMPSEQAVELMVEIATRREGWWTGSLNARSLGSGCGRYDRAPDVVPGALLLCAQYMFNRSNTEHVATSGRDSSGS